MAKAELTPAEAAAKAELKARNKAYFAELLELLEPFGDDVTGRAMFGGHGFWDGGDMFALLSSEGKLYFKADETSEATFRKARSKQFAPEMSHSDGPMPMPYWSVPASVLKDDAKLAAWTEQAIAVGHATSKKKKPAKKPPRVDER